MSMLALCAPVVYRLSNIYKKDIKLQE